MKELDIQRIQLCLPLQNTAVYLMITTNDFVTIQTRMTVQTENLALRRRLEQLGLVKELMYHELVDYLQTVGAVTRVDW